MVGLFRINIPGDYRGRIRKREKLGCYIVTVKPQPPKPQGARGLGFSSSYWPVLQKGCLWVGWVRAVLEEVHSWAKSVKGTAGSCQLPALSAVRQWCLSPERREIWAALYCFHYCLSEQGTFQLTPEWCDPILSWDRYSYPHFASLFTSTRVREVKQLAPVSMLPRGHMCVPHPCRSIYTRTSESANGTHFCKHIHERLGSIATSTGEGSVFHFMRGGRASPETPVCSFV